MDMTLNDRMNLLSKKRHCFGCLQPLKPQHTNTCDNRFNCRTCSGGIVVYVSKKKKNAEDFQRSKGESVANTFADLKTPSAAEKHQTKVITMCIVALKKDVLTFAMLDNCSQGSFIQEALVDRLQVDGAKDGNKK